MKDSEGGFCFRTPLPVSGSQDGTSFCSEAKRPRLCHTPSRVSSVYNRIFDRKISSANKDNESHSASNGSFFGSLLPFAGFKSPIHSGDVCHYFLQSLLPNNRTQALKMKQSAVFSSTPLNGNVKPLKNGHIPSQRLMYQRLLDKAAFPRTPCVKRSSSLREIITIDLDDENKSQRFSLLRRCNLSPVISNNNNKLQSSVEQAGVNDRTVAAVSPDTSDSEVRAWLESCGESPYLSDSWLKNLTSSYRDKKKERERDSELAQANIQFWEKQRNLAEKERIDNLEQRLACLLRTPPILEDPYLVPQPIPIELPYKPAKVKEPKVPSLPVLTAPQLAEVEAALRSGSPDQVLADKFRLVVTRRELMTLSGTNWLSDMVINFYLQLLQHRSQRQKNLPRLAVLSTFFYAKLTSPNGGGYPGVRRWTRQMKLFDQDIVLVPIHDRGMHWCLSCIDLRAKSITYYDSMGGGNTKCLQQLMDYLKNESLDKRNLELPDSDSWEFINTEDTVPQQYNGSDCGVFMCTFSEFISRGAPFTFSQKQFAFCAIIWRNLI
uniref:Ubiquitin-like protease family profile domain-containing protein n=1 Tax=Trichobilharzia regenti TaxID=157069 RepID=A0AA85IZP4_TRIRE|nr:unnamed protein product [Trichobilharzia regenti]